MQDRRIKILKETILSFNKYFENIKNIFIPIAKTKHKNPISELINNFYSNNQCLLNLFLLKPAYNFHHVLQIH